MGLSEIECFLVTMIFVRQNSKPQSVLPFDPINNLKPFLLGETSHGISQKNYCGKQEKDSDSWPLLLDKKFKRDGFNVSQVPRGDFIDI
jgi:hypothetical protein